MKTNSISRLAVAGLFVACSTFGIRAAAQPVLPDVTATGLVTCAHCVDLSQHKGFTRWTWATYRVSQGDQIVLMASGKLYKLQGDRQQLSKYVEDKVTLSGHLLDADTIEVANIEKSGKEK